MSELSSLGVVPVLRAVTISLVLVLAFLQASPGEPLHQRELGPLEQAFSAAGMGGAGALISDSVLEASRVLMKLRRSVLKPMLRVTRELGMGQRWRLFTVRGQHVYRIQVEALQLDQRWRLLYRAHELDTLGLAAQLTYRRLRGIYDPRNKEEAGAQYEAFVKWISDTVLARHPEFLGVRVSMERLRLGAPAQATELASVEHTGEVYRPGTP